MRESLPIKPALAAAIIISAIAACEKFTKPNPVAFNFDYLALNYLPMLLLFLLFFAVSNRMVFSASAASSVALGLVAISNRKFAVLDKPLIPSDFLLAKHVIDSPELYIRYVQFSAVAVSMLVAAFLFFCYRREPRHLVPGRTSVLIRVSMAAAAVTFFTSVTDADSFIGRTYSSNTLKYSNWDPRSSVYHSGLFYSFIRMSDGMTYSIPDDYGDASLVKELASAPLHAERTGTGPRTLPDIVVVQSESFYDMRQHELEFDPSAYAAYDKASQKAAVRGSVKVPTVGGNTVKTEFSFLTGVESSVMPCDYPYRFLAKRNIWSIAWYLRSLGYETVAVHPYSRTFWDRNLAYGFLGIGEFLSEGSFLKSPKEGPYVSDQAVTEKVTDLLREKKGPLFIFAVTMENHGPWDKPRVEKRARFKVRGEVSDLDTKRVGRYLHHVTHAGQMAYGLVRHLERRQRPGVLAFYGDHPPGFCSGAEGGIPMKPGYDLYQTPYFIWRNFGPVSHVSRDISVSFLASEILDQAGINDDPYFRANSYVKSKGTGSLESLHSDRLHRSYVQLLYDNLSGNLSSADFGPVPAR